MCIIDSFYESPKNTLIQAGERIVAHSSRLFVSFSYRRV
jgi:hypothetical protein